MKTLERVQGIIQDPAMLIQISEMPRYKVTRKQIAEMRFETRKQIIRELELYRCTPSKKQIDLNGLMQ